jgi:RHS repeat-associated protein
MQAPLKRYELTDHLGNVAAVVTGRLLPGNGSGASKQAELISAQGYEPFGSLLPGRNYSSDSYRFGFQGQEKDDEIYGATGTSHAFEYRMHDARVGKFWSIDPLAAKYPHYSPYHFAGNTPIVAFDLEGLEDVWFHTFRFENGMSQTMAVFREDANFEQVKQDMCNLMGWDPSTLPVSGMMNTFAMYGRDGSISNQRSFYFENGPSVKPSFGQRALKGMMDLERSMKGSTYGEGEDWISSASFDVKGGVSAGRYSADFQFGLYSTNESSVGLFMKLEYSAGTKSDWKVGAHLSGGIDANSGNPFSEPLFNNKTSANVDAGLSYSGVLLNYNAEADHQGGTNQTVGLRGGMGKSEVSGNVKNTTSVLLKTNEVGLSGK